MGTLFGFAIGYIVGARAGSQSFDEVVEAVRAIRSSEEYEALIEIVKTHVKGTAATVGRWLAEVDEASAEDLVAQARQRAGSR